MPSSYPDCASTVHKLTFSPVSSEATAQVFSLHPLAEGSRKASRPAMQSGTCLLHVSTQTKDVHEAVVHTWLCQVKADFSRRGNICCIVP